MPEVYRFFGIPKAPLICQKDDKRNMTFDEFQKYMESGSTKKPKMTSDELHDAWWNVANQMGASDDDNNPCGNGCDWKVYDSGFTKFEYCVRCNQERSI